MAPQETPLIPRKVLFGNPDRTSVLISPDGAHLGWLAPLDGVLNVWVAPRDRPAVARAVTRDTGRGIRWYLWAHTSRHVLYGQDRDGDENWHVYCVDLGDGSIRDLTPFENTQAQIIGISHRHPYEVVVGLNNRDPRFHDLHHLDIPSGVLTLLARNERYASIDVDDDLAVRIATRMEEDGGLVIERRTGGGAWESWQHVPPEDALTTSPAGFDGTGRVMYLRDSRGRDTAALVAVSLEGNERTLLAADARVDVGEVVLHPTSRKVRAVSFVHERARWQILDPEIEEDMNRLRGVCEGEMEIVSGTTDDTLWVVVYVQDIAPARYYLYDRRAGSATFLFTDRSALEGATLARMHSAVVKSRDGLDLVCYYTLPPWSDADNDGIPDRPLATVLVPHGGPWGRDHWGFRGWHQWLANRGYAVLNVNFRASTGFGKSFTNAGDRQWGEAVIRDQQDAVDWAIARRIADPAKVAVMGGSFGGYSVLAGLTFYPDRFACGVDIVGPANLITLLESIPPYWKPTLQMFTTRIGDPRTPEGRALLRSHSPLTHVDRIRRPLLIGQGANDPRVKQAESDQIVAAMKAKGIPVTYVLYPDEGHGFARPENNLSFSAMAEAFLSKVVGGRCEPIGDDFRGSSHRVLHGDVGTPGT